MIQRIQSVFLAIAGLFTFGLFALPFATTEEAIAGSNFFVDGDYDVQDHFAMLILFGVAGVISLVTIFLYNNRPLQAKMTIFGLISNILGIVATIVLFLNFTSPVVPENSIDDGFGIYLPVVAGIFLFLAFRNINKDEKLVRSADRLR